MSKRGRVIAVRGRGGEGVEVVRQKVTVTRESPSGQGEGLQAVLEQERWEEERRKELEDHLVLAEVRGLQAIEKEERARFLQERTEKDGLELKKSVRLVEDLRAAKVVKQRKPVIHDVKATDEEDKENQWRPFKQLGDVQRSGGLDLESPFHCCEVSRHKPSQKSSRATSLNRPGLPLGATASAKNILPSSRKNSLRPQSVSSEKAHMISEQDLRLINQEPPQLRSKSSNSQAGHLGLSAEEKKRGKEQLEKLLGSLGSLDSTEEVSQLSTILEKSESSLGRDLVDLVPVRGPTPAEDSAASSISPFPSSRIVSSRREKEAGKEEKAPSLDSVAALVSRIKQQREALEKQEKKVSQPSQAFLPTIKSGVQQPVPQQYKLNTDFIKKVLEFSRSSDLASSSSSSEAHIKVNVVLPASSSTLSEPSPILKPQQINSGLRPAKTNPRSSEKRSKKKLSQKQFEDDAEAEKQKKLRYYIEKLLQMKHEEVENLSSASTNDSRKQVNILSVAFDNFNIADYSHCFLQVRFHESSWLQDGDTTLYCQPPASSAVHPQLLQDFSPVVHPQAFQDFSPHVHQQTLQDLQRRQGEDSTLYHQPPTRAVHPQEVEKRGGGGEAVRREREVEAEVFQSISHTSDLLLTHTTVDEVSPRVLQAKILKTRQVLQQKLSLLERPRPPSPGLSSGPLTPSTLSTISPSSFPPTGPGGEHITPSSFRASPASGKDRITPSSLRGTPSLSIFSDLSDTTAGTSTISHIDLSEDNSHA